MQSCSIRILVNDVAGSGGVGAEHGLSMHISTAAGAVLFDTGQSDLLIANAEKLGINLSAIDAIAVSHGHYDHTGGLGAAHRLAPQAPVYLHPGALSSKYAKDDRGSRYIGMAESDKAAVARQFSASGKPREILPGIWLTGQVPRRTAEDVGGPFYADAACTQPDQLIDDQAMVIEGNAGLIVVLGCAHAGVVNTLKHVDDLFDGTPIAAVIGGMHLLHADKARLEQTAEALEEFGIQLLAPLHCTGQAAVEYLQKRFGAICNVTAAGSTFELS